MSCNLPRIAWSSALASLSEAKCLRGQIEMCVGACGPISSNANTSSSSYTNLEGIFFAPILQNKQSALMHSSCGRAFIQADHHGCKALMVAKLLAELARGVFSGDFAHPHAIKQSAG